MAILSGKTKISADSWSANKRYRVGAIVSVAESDYQNLTGINSNPSEPSVNWLLISVPPPVDSVNKVLVNGNEFILIKHPDNDTDGFESVLEVNDFISSGFFDANTYWPNAQCLDAANPNNANSWFVPSAIEELTIN